MRPEMQLLRRGRLRMGANPVGIASLNMPEPIDAPPERIAEVVLRAGPKTDWRHLEEHRSQG